MSRKKAGQGYVFKPVYTDRHGKKKEGRVWWCGYSIRGEKHRESTGYAEHKAAIDFLAARIRLVGKNKPSPKQIDAITFEDMMQALRDYYTRNRLKGASRLESSVNVLSKYFAGWKATDISDHAIEDFQARRIDEGRQPATVNWDLSVLRRGFKLLRKRGLPMPDITSLRVSNTREGFVTEVQLQRLLAELPPVHRGWVEFCFVSGWRVDSEALSRTWANVDFENNFICLNASETKTNKPRKFPLIERVRRILDVQLEQKAKIERKHRIVSTYIFAYDSGRQIKHPHKAWKKSTQAAGLPGLLRHDLRRSAIVCLERAGVPRSVAMQLSGHVSQAVYSRYCIVSEAMLTEAGAKLQALADATPDRKVIPITG